MRSPLFALCLALATISGLASAQQPIAGEFEQGGYHYSVAPAPDFVLQREIPMQWPVVGGNSELPRWRTWLVDSQIDHRGAKVRYYHDQAYEPIASELVGDAAKFSIQFNPLYQGLVLHTVAVRRDGVWSNRLKPAKISLARREEGFENDLADGQVTALILMEDIRARDLVRVTYSVVGSNPIVASSQTDTFNLGWVDSILDRYVRVIYPPRTALDWKIFNDAPRPKLIESEDRVELRAHAHSVAAIRNEQDYPNWYNPFPRMQVAQRRSWADVVAWALPLYPEPGALPQDLQQRVDEWRRVDDPHAKAMAVLRAVQDEVRYFGTEMGDSTHRPADPALTWQQKYGDCKDKAYLASTLLRYLGFSAEPALVSLSSGRALSNMLPAAELFDHVIVRLRIGDDTFWLDPTLSKQRGDLRQLDLGDYGVALPIAAGVAALQQVVAPKGARNAVTIKETFSPAADGGRIDLVVATEYVGQRAEQMRRSIGAAGTDDIAKQYFEFYRKRYGDLSVVKPLEVDDGDPGNVLRLVEHYSLVDGWVQKNGQQRLIDVYADALAADVALPDVTDRKGPIGMRRPAVLDHVIALQLPDGWSLADPPEATEVATDEFRFRREVSRTPGKAVIGQRLEFFTDNVAADRADDFIGKLRQVSDAIGLRLDVRADPRVGKSDRDQRLRRLLRDAIDDKEQDHE